MLARTRLLPLCLVLSWACSNERPPALDALGDPCRSLQSHCVDDESARSCEDNAWTIISCDELCARMGPSYVADGCDDECVCILADPDGCTPGETACVDEMTLSTCDEFQTEVSESCESVCAEQGLASAGCVPESQILQSIIDPAECWCTHEGTPCEASTPPSCVDGATVGSCIDGIWVFEDCAELCGESNATCSPWLDPPGCAC